MSGEVIFSIATRIVNVLLFAFALSVLIKAWQRKTLEAWVYWFVAVCAINIIVSWESGLLHEIAQAAWGMCIVGYGITLFRAWKALRAKERRLQRESREIEELCALLNQRLAHMYSTTLPLENSVESKKDINDIHND